MATDKSPLKGKRGGEADPQEAEKVERRENRDKARADMKAARKLERDAQKELERLEKIADRKNAKDADREAARIQRETVVAARVEAKALRRAATLAGVAVLKDELPEADTAGARVAAINGLLPGVVRFE